MAGGRPTVEIVIRRALMPRPRGRSGLGQGRQQAIEVGQRLAHAHHDHVAQPLVGRQQPIEQAAFVRRFRRRSGCGPTPSNPLAQNTQPIAQPTWVLMQIVRRAASRSSTHSICWPSASSHQQLFGAVVGVFVRDDPRGPQAKIGGQGLAQRLGQVGHVIQASCAAGE